MIKINNNLLKATMLLSGFASIAVSCDKETIYVEPEAGVSRLTVSPLSVDMGYGDEVSFTVGIRPVESNVTWESSDPTVAYVDEESYQIIPLGVGEVEITAKAGTFTQTIPVKIHSSIIVGGDVTYMDEGDSSELPNIKILPENTRYTVSSSNSNILSVPDDSRLEVKAIGTGIANLSITTEDAQKATVKVGVASKDNALTARKADAWLYNGNELGHPGYGIVALALQPDGVSYEDGGNWTTDNGKGLFLKIYLNNSLSRLQSGTYTAGTGDFNFYAKGQLSYVISGTSKTGLTAGTLEINESGIAGYVSSNSEVFKVNYSGNISYNTHSYGMSEYQVTVDDKWCDGTSQVCLDTKGTKLYGGATNGWQYRLRNSAKNTYLTLLVYASNDEDPTGNYPFSMGWCDRNRVMVNTGYAFYSSIVIDGKRYHFGDSNTNYSQSHIDISDYSYDGGATLISSISGKIYSTYSEEVSEINETRNIPMVIDVNVKNKTFDVSNNRLAN